LSAASQAEPRIGIAYNVKPTNTVLRISYARTLETPFNENLIISTTGCDVSVIAALIPCVPANSPAGYRNEFHAGLEQAFGKYLVLDGETFPPMEQRVPTRIRRELLRGTCLVRA
jgi:hypothetical protein